MPSNEESKNLAFVAILEAGERLLAALDEERRLSKTYPKQITGVFEYLESLSLARKTVDQRAKEYYTVIAENGFPDLPIRHVIEDDDNRLRWGWPPLPT